MLRQFSSRRAAEQRRRREWLQRTTHGPVRCSWPAGCVNEAIDPHEILTRARGGSTTDPDNVLPLCRNHHDWIGRNPAQAQAMGLLASAAPIDRVRHAWHDLSVPTPRPAPPKVAKKPTHTPKVALRLTAAGIEYADQLATETGRLRSDVLRAMFSVASGHRDEVVARLTSQQ